MAVLFSLHIRAINAARRECCIFPACGCAGQNAWVMHTQFICCPMDTDVVVVLTFYSLLFQKMQTIISSIIKTIIYRENAFGPPRGLL